MASTISRCSSGSDSYFQTVLKTNKNRVIDRTLLTRKQHERLLSIPRSAQKCPPPPPRTRKVKRCKIPKICPPRIDQLAIPATKNTLGVLQTFNKVLEPIRVVRLVKLTHAHEGERPKFSKKCKKKQIKKKSKKQKFEECMKVWLKKRIQVTTKVIVCYLKRHENQVTPNYRQLLVALGLMKSMKVKKKNLTMKHTKQYLMNICEQLAIVCDTECQPYKKPVGPIEYVPSEETVEESKRHVYWVMREAIPEDELEEEEEREEGPEGEEKEPGKPTIPYKRSTEVGKPGEAAEAGREGEEYLSEEEKTELSRISEEAEAKEGEGRPEGEEGEVGEGEFEGEGEGEGEGGISPGDEEGYTTGREGETDGEEPTWEGGVTDEGEGEIGEGGAVGEDGIPPGGERTEGGAVTSPEGGAETTTEEAAEHPLEGGPEGTPESPGSAAVADGVPGGPAEGAAEGAPGSPGGPDAGTTEGAEGTAGTAGAAEGAPGTTDGGPGGTAGETATPGVEAGEGAAAGTAEGAGAVTEGAAGPEGVTEGGAGRPLEEGPAGPEGATEGRPGGPLEEGPAGAPELDVEGVTEVVEGGKAKSPRKKRETGAPGEIGEEISEEGEQMEGGVDARPAGGEIPSEGEEATDYGEEFEETFPGMEYEGEEGFGEEGYAEYEEEFIAEYGPGEFLPGFPPVKLPPGQVLIAATGSRASRGKPGEVHEIVQAHPPNSASYLSWKVYLSWLEEFGCNINIYGKCLRSFKDIIEAKYQNYTVKIHTILTNWGTYLRDSLEFEKQMTAYFKGKAITKCPKCGDYTLYNIPRDHDIPPELRKAAESTAKWKRLLEEAERVCMSFVMDDLSIVSHETIEILDTSQQNSSDSSMYIFEDLSSSYGDKGFK